MEQDGGLPAAQFPILVEPCVRDYLVEWLSPVLLFFIGTVSFIYRVFSQVQETEFVSEDNIYYPPLSF